MGLDSRNFPMVRREGRRINKTNSISRLGAVDLDDVNMRVVFSDILDHLGDRQGELVVIV